MKHLSQKSRAAQAGMSLVSIIFGIAIGGIAIVVALEQVRNTRQMSNDFARQDVLGNLEDKVRSAIRFGIGLNMDHNPSLQSCVSNLEPCPKSPTAITLWMAEGAGGLITRQYKMGGEPCPKGASKCDLEVTATFTASCASPPCNPPTQIIFNYAISMVNSGTTIRRGMEWYSVYQKPMSDNVISCPFTEDGHTQFLRKLGSGEPDCQDVSVGKLEGDESRCIQGKQLLAGVDDKSAAICEDIFFKK